MHYYNIAQLWDSKICLYNWLQVFVKWIDLHWRTRWTIGCWSSEGRRCQWRELPMTSWRCSGTKTIKLFWCSQDPHLNKFWCSQLNWCMLRKWAIPGLFSLNFSRYSLKWKEILSCRTSNIAHFVKIIFTIWYSLTFTFWYFVKNEMLAKIGPN